MNSIALEELATDQNFEESAYLTANPDVAEAVRAGSQKSGRSHFEMFGRSENRRLQHSPTLLSEAKASKLSRLAPLLRSDMSCDKTEHYYDFLTEELRSQFKIVDTDAVSSNSYDSHVMNLITKYESGWVLDCGAGKRPIYFDNVINFEIAPYSTTDVRGVGEVLPFVEDSFDAVISIAVLEHVKDPFLCAKEIARVLKPGGKLICCVPFLQPLHGYPHHYYNMTHQGLSNLFEDLIEIDKLDVYSSVVPIWSLTWIIQSWADGLKGAAKEEFLNLKLSDLMQSADRYLDRAFVKDLPMDKNFELASATVLFGHKA